MRLVFHAKGWEDYRYWQETDKATLKKLNALIAECLRTPFSGTGKPEALRHELQGCWSRRLTQEHRLIYCQIEDDLVILQCRYHY